MNKNSKKFLIIVGVLFVFFIIYSSITNEETIDTSPETEGIKAPVTTSPPEQPAPVKYFAPDSDKITISASDKVFYTNNPTTTLSYYALDGSNQPAHFREGDRAFVRILGISVAEPYTQNAEIFHPEKPDGSKDNTIFLGNISITETGKYLIKVCLGSNINLNSEGTMVWPFGCFEDSASEVVDVKKK